MTNSTNYEPRAEKVGRFLKKQGCQVLWIEADFSHAKKKKLKRQIDDHLYIDTVPYRKNISLKRMYSQYDFAQKVFRILKEEPIDLLYVMIPANSLTPVAANLRKRGCTKLVVDIIDLWPESLPVKRLKDSWPIQYWRRLRDDYLDYADLVLTECKLYQDILHLDERTRPNRTAVMYWPKEKEAVSKDQVVPEHEFKRSNELHIAYLGYINNIIDMEQIVELLQKVNERKKLCLHIIGDGEKRELFLEKLSQAGIGTEYHGIIYEEQRKKQIFDKCCFGLNMMKESVCVGLTMKSVDYFCYGLPLINNIRGDTWELIEEYGIGVNYGGGQAEQCAEQIIRTSETVKEKRHLIRRLYEQLFTQEAMEVVLDKEVLPLLKKEI